MLALRLLLLNAIQSTTPTNTIDVTELCYSSIILWAEQASDRVRPEGEGEGEGEVEGVPIHSGCWSLGIGVILHDIKKPLHPHRILGIPRA